MSLQLAAQHLAAQGRGPDKQLVHMSPREVAGLQALAMAHGGSLSINPDTGLPEAGFLDSLLPAIIGGGLMFATGGLGAAAMPGLFGLGMPATIGLGVGALQTARTGDLGKGIMAGLGAYGGAGLAGGLAAAGTGALSQAAGTAGASTVTPVAAEAGLTQGAADIGNIYAQEQAAQNAIANKLAAATPTETAKAGFEQIVKNPSQLFNKGNLRYGLAAAAPALMVEPKTQMPELDSEQHRYSYTPGRVADPRAGYPEDYRGEYEYFRPSYTRLAEGGSIGNIIKNISLGGGGSDDISGYRYEYDPVRQMYKKIEPSSPSGGKEKTTSGDTRGDSGGGAFGPGAMSSGRETDMSPFSAIAAGQALQGYGNMLGGFMPGGSIANAIGGGLVGYGQNAISQNQAALDAEMGASINAAEAAAANEAGISAAFGNSDSSHAGSDHGAGIDSSGMYNMGGITAMARGGYSHLGDYSDGGRLLRGPGDGVSDSIPAMIGNKRPARLADGEFVVPARIVSELGNGSTEAGARKLYAMMDRVQRARGKTTGKGKVAKNTRAEKYLPA